MTIRKAIFPVAGIGSRFLPATKANPKEMLPIVDKPLIQYAVEEAIASGITDLIFVTSSSKRAIEDHFDKNHELEAILAAQGKTDLLNIIRNVVPENVNCIYIRQPEPLGLGDAVLRAQSLIGDEYFAVLLADDLFSQNCLAQLTAEFAKEAGNLIAVEQVFDEKITQYGVIAIEPSSNGKNKMKMTGIVEKPTFTKAPSHFGVAGRYILSPKIFKYLLCCERDARGEIQLTDAISMLLKTEPTYALRFKGKRYDCGSKLGYLQATVEMALRHPEVGEAFDSYLKHQLTALSLIIE